MRITAFPMQKGEVRGFCTKVRGAPGSMVAAKIVEDWLTELAQTIFGPNLRTRERNLGYPQTLHANDVVEAVLELRWVRRIPGSFESFAEIGVSVLSGEKIIVEGSYTIIIPP